MHKKQGAFIDKNSYNSNISWQKPAKLGGIRMTKAEQNKKLIEDFYREFFNGHDVNSALKYVREDYIQHNPGVDQGRAALMEAFDEKFKEWPDFRLDIKMLISDEDMIAVYLKNVDTEGNTKCRVVDIYRIQDGKLAEHWDVLQPV